MIPYFSYSSYSLLKSDPEKFFLTYMNGPRGPRDPQNHYMSIGSSFDAFAKSALHKDTINDGDQRFELRTLFEEQVEPQHRDKAWVDGEFLFKFYQVSGAYSRILKELEGCVGPPRFESKITAQIGEALILGKPDIYWINKLGCRMTHDFKVNGFYSKSPPSPRKGYTWILPGGLMHQNCVPTTHKGVVINSVYKMDQTAPDWATQLSMYSWIMGSEVGSDFILSIDQICCNANNGKHRIARLCSLVDEKFQLDLYNDLQKCWRSLLDGHVFMNLTYEDNLAKIDTLRLTNSFIADERER